MGNLLLLAILYLIYTGLSFWLFNGNFMSPSFVFSFSISIMLCLAYYTANTFGLLFAIGIRTFSIFATAGLIFIASELFVYLSRTSSCNLNLVKPNIEYKPLIISKQMQFCLTCFFILSVLVAMYVVYINTSGGSWSQRLRQYRQFFFHDPEVIRFRFINAQLYKLNVIVADFCGYVMIYNITVCNVPIRKVLGYVFDSFLYLVFTVFSTGGRQIAIEGFLYFIMIYLVLNMKPGDRKKIYRFMGKVIPILILVAALFTVSGELIGRYKSEKSSMQNLAEYFCGGLYAFNNHLDDPPPAIWGQATFTYIYVIPQNIGLIPRNDENMVKGDFDIYGNTVTIFGRWYRDFGATGVFVMTCIVSLLFSLAFYNKVIYSSNLKSEHHLARILYCQFMMVLVWAGYDDRVAALLTVQTIVSVIVIRVLFWLLIEKKAKLI